MFVGSPTDLLYWRYTLLSTRWLQSHQKTSEGKKQAYFCWFLNEDIHEYMFIEGKPRAVIFLQTLNLQLHLLRRMKKSNIRSLWTWPWGQLSIGERQATCRALGNWFSSKIIAIVSVASVELSRFVTSELLIPSNKDKQEWSDGNWLETGSNWSSKRKSNCPTSWVHLDYVNV